LGIEVNTVWLVAGALSTSFGLVVMLLRTRYTEHFERALRLWGESCLCIGIAFWMASSSQRAALSLASPSLGIVAITLQYLAVTDLKQQRRQLLWVRVPTALACVGYLWFGIVQPNITVGLFVVNAIRTVFLARIAVSFAQPEGGRRQFVDMLAGAIFAIVAFSALAVVLDMVRSHQFDGGYNFSSPRTGYAVIVITVSQAILFTLFILAMTERLNQELKHQSMHDPLTSLFNRRAIEEIGFHQQSLSLRSGQPFSVFMIDVDHFKQINDAHGHATGDAVLKSVAAALHAGLRNEDYLGRWGGDEFCVLLPGADREEAKVIAGRILANFRSLNLSVGDESVATEVSMGIASVEQNGGGFEALLHLADSALYEAKRAGRGRYVFAGSVETATDAALSSR
jgi:diguanylate cyclase (GGDEF)-like protein